MKKSFKSEVSKEANIDAVFDLISIAGEYAGANREKWGKPSASC